MASRACQIAVKRVYDPASPGDGRRILVDRIWPRGVSKDAARLAAWVKDVAPSTALRKWFGHDPEKWEEFEKRYLAELEAHEEALEPLREAMRGANKVTLLFGAKDERHNNAVALRRFLERRAGRHSR